MSLIKIDTDSLFSKSKDIDKQISDLEGISKRLTALIARVADSWTGAASDQYVLLLRKYVTQIETLLKVLREFKNYAYNTAKEFSDLDSSSANKLRG